MLNVSADRQLYGPQIISRACVVRVHTNCTLLYCIIGLSQPHHLLLVTPTNSSQSDTIQNHICKEQGKDSFYIDFIQQFIITIAFSHLGMAGGVPSLLGQDKISFSYVR